MRRVAAFVLVAAVVAGPAVASTAVPAPPDVDPAIDAIVRPLAHAPSIQTGAQPLLVELDPARFAGDPTAVTATLTPSFGKVAVPVALGNATGIEEAAASGLWPGRQVLRLRFALPASLPEDLYDLAVTWGDDALGRTADLQRRAVRVVADFPQAPRVAVLADPSIGDPRPLQEGVTEALPPGLPYPPDTRGDPTVLPEKVFGTAGNPAEGEERWAALNAAIDEINLVKPDLVLIAGDVTFAAHPRGYPYEYAEAWRVLDRLEVPSFAAPGNHDLYSLDYDRYPEGDSSGRPFTADGLREWQRWFGPLHYSVDVDDAFHLVALNTFDWDDLRPFPPPDFETLSGGNVRAAQLDWLVADLAAYRARRPAGALVTFAHHDPSWLARRHPWPDRGNRDTVRELLATFDVWAHFAGHTHEDRVARYHERSIVETNGRQHLAAEYPLGQLHYLDHAAGDADPGTFTQQELGAILREPGHGPLFVTTTTAASGLIGEDWGLGGYWGWRLATLSPQPGGGYDPIDFGYAARAPLPDVAAFLAESAARPERWNPDHAVYGVYSVPTGRLVQEVSADGRTVTVHNRLLQELAVEVRVTLPAASAGQWRPEVGEIVRLRTGGGVAEAAVRLTVPAGESRTVAASAPTRR